MSEPNQPLGDTTEPSPDPRPVLGVWPQAQGTRENPKAGASRDRTDRRPQACVCAPWSVALGFS